MYCDNKTKELTRKYGIDGWCGDPRLASLLGFLFVEDGCSDPYGEADVLVDIGAMIKKVIFNDKATIIVWKDGVKTVVKCGEHDHYDKEKGFAMAIIKRLMGNKGNYNDLFKKYVEDY